MRKTHNFTASVKTDNSILDQKIGSFKEGRETEVEKTDNRGPRSEGNDFDVFTQK